MKIILSGGLQDLQHAKAWVTDVSLFEVLDDLEAMVRRRENSWGPCTVFIENTFNISGFAISAQTDLVISFRDRVALCEIKQGSFPNRDLDNLARQIGGQLTVFKGHLIRAGFDPGNLHAFLWVPNILEKHEIDSMIYHARVINAWRHITISGGNPAFRDVILQEGIPGYLPQAIDERLQIGYTPGKAGAQRGLAEYLTGILEHGRNQIEIPPLEFPDFSSVREYLLSALPRNNVELVPESTHVQDLRVQSMNEATELLDKTNMIEIIGPMGVGKSTFIKDVLISLLGSLTEQYYVRKNVLQRKQSLREVLSSLARDAGILSAAQIDDLDADGLFFALSQMEFVYWISDYDSASHAAVRQLAQHLTNSAANHPAFWVIESMIVPNDSVSQAPVEACQIRLEPFDNQALATILQKHSPGDNNADLSATISAAGGNPRWAILHRTLPEGSRMPEADKLDTYELFLLHLKRDERRLLVAIAYILSEAPLGTTIRLVEEWFRAINSYTPEASRLVARGVIETAHKWRLISLELVGSQSSGIDPTAQEVNAVEIQAVQEGPSAVLQGFLPATVQSASAGWIRVLDPHFIEYFVQKISEDERRDWKARLEDVLISSLEDDLSLTGVTFSLMNGDFQPFARSSFCSSSAVLPNIAAWLSEKDDPFSIETAEANTVYFRRWLEWLLDHYWDTTPSEAARECGVPEIAPPDPEEPLQVQLYDSLRVRGHSYWNGHDYEWKTWNETAEEFRRSGKTDLWAEAILRQAQSRLRPPYNDIVRAWKLMERVLKQEDELSAQAGRSMMYFHVLSFLNKTKLWELQLPDLRREAPQLIADLSQRMIRCGLAMENLNSIANALFFFSRSIEIDNRPKNLEEVELYLGIMRFVERVSPARRVQALLTQGSIHRHYFSEGQPEWREFRDHADQALQAYQRAFDSAGKMGMGSLPMNALSYMASVLEKGLRFVEEPEAREWLKQYTPSTLRKLMDLKTLPPAPGMEDLDEGPSNQDLRYNIHKHLAILKWIAGVLIDAAELEKLPPVFDDLVLGLREKTQPLIRRDKIKVYHQVITDLSRTIAFTKTEPLHRETLDSCKGALCDLIGDTVDLLPPGEDGRRKSNLRKNGTKMLSLLTEEGLSVPPNLREVFLT